MRIMTGVVVTRRLDSSTVMMLLTVQAAHQTHRHRAGHHGVGADKHRRPFEP